MLDEILEAIPDLGHTAFISEYIIDLHSDSISVHSRRGYFSLEDIFELRTCQASYLDNLPDLNLTPHSIAAIFCSLIIVLLFPSGATHTPNILEFSYAFDLFSETN